MAIPTTVYVVHDFDSGRPENNALAGVGIDSDTGFSADEVYPSPGDSSGPVFIDGAVAGVTQLTMQGLPGYDATDDVDWSWGELAFDVRVSGAQDFIRQATDGQARFVLPKPGDFNSDDLLAAVRP